MARVVKDVAGFRDWRHMCRSLAAILSLAVVDVLAGCRARMPIWSGRNSDLPGHLTEAPLARRPCTDYQAGRLSCTPGFGRLPGLRRVEGVGQSDRGLPAPSTSSRSGLLPGGPGERR